MHNINKNKIIKTLVILVGVCVLAGGLTKLSGVNSMTLTEYVEKNGGTVPTASSEDTQEAESRQDKPEPEIETEEAASLQPDIPTQEILQTEPVEDTESTLTGAVLNGDSQEDQRITYKDSFYYEPLSDSLKRYITGVSFPAASENSVSLAISYEELRYVHILYYDFDGNPAEGELICNEYIAQDLVEIFYELYKSEYQLEKVRLIDEYSGDDLASMEDNNTSCFNYRVVEGTDSLSKHALGLAVDVNPLYNPYVTYTEDGSEDVSPAAAVDYADRDASFPYKIDENDLCYKLFKEHGFTWGGDWNSCKDYQHFQKTP